ncbi:MAG: hypothetical protein ACRD6X_01360 [Pyrinomonadaceae bacterium]
MQFDLSNQVIASIDDKQRALPRRTLDLGNIYTPELGLLSPQRSEIAPRGGGRDTALIAYSERLRDGYKANEGGIRDGMLKLGEAFRDGQTIAVSCFCRAGEICHADVVKKAIEKVGQAIIAREHVALRSKELTQEPPTPHQTNPRTERTINEILSVGTSDRILSKLDDTEGRNRSEHASHLNRHSQFIRDLYERGAVVRDGVLISPKDIISSTPPLAVTTVEYAVKRLESMSAELNAKELAPQIVEYGTKIAGDSPDRDTKLKVFNWIYGALEGRGDLLLSEDKIRENETKEERFDRTLKEIAGLAEEMSKLEPSDRLVPIERLSEYYEIDAEISTNDLSLKEVYEEAISREESVQQTEWEQTTSSGIQEFERVELGNTELSRHTAEMSQDELDRWINARLPVLDEMLESGTPVETILKPYQNDIFQAVKNDPANKQAAVDDLRFAAAYIEYQLKQPESRLRHFNPRYRNYSVMLERAASREEVIDAASLIRLENARLGFKWDQLTGAEKTKTPRPLTSKEMQFLFTEASPRHYTTEMTAFRLAYSNAGDAARTKTDALLRGEITPTSEAQQLIESLEARMGRRYLKDSLAATKHFLQSLKTPNDELRYRNPFDHAEMYRKLPPAEKDFVYQRASIQKEILESKLIGNASTSRTLDQEAVKSEGLSAKINSFRESLKGDLVEVLTGNPGMNGKPLSDRIAGIVEKNLESLGSEAVPKSAVLSLSSKIGDATLQRWQRDMPHYDGIKDQSRQPPGRDAAIGRMTVGNPPER